MHLDIYTLVILVSVVISTILVIFYWPLWVVGGMLARYWN